MQVLPSDITRPARYIGIEPNIFIKDLKDVKIRFALCYPDIYEVGMSYFGHFLLYELANSVEGVWCERCFAPWIDMDNYLQKNNIPLATLESKTPLNKMDIVGFSLTYELNITNVLNMLKLGRIKKRAEERVDGPIIIGGGPLSLNPAPFEEFFDLIVTGEAEEVLVDILNTLKLLNGEARSTTIHELSKLEGVYSPLFKKSSVRRLFIKDIDRSFHPVRPPIPVVGSIHNRLNVEVSRGCGNGCRFCLAGFGYRPYRERSFESVIGIIDNALKSTGYEEISLLSLSSGEYKSLFRTISYIKNRYKNVSVSLPSLRVGSINNEEIEIIGDIARTGLTFAIESPSTAIRGRLNKDIDLDQLINQIPVLKQHGWRSLKLYIMIGFPWEIEDDLIIIKDFIKEFKKGGININLAVSPFIPKPHTPFQWLPMDDEDSLAEKIKIIKDALRRTGIKVKYRGIKTSIIEAIISRGDRKLTSLFDYLSENNVKLEAWKESFNPELYTDWFTENGIDIRGYLGEKDPQMPLPWDFIDTGVKKSFLMRELQNAQDGIFTDDCHSGCASCGLGCEVKKTKNEEGIMQTFSESQTPIIIEPISLHTECPSKYTFRYGKYGDARYIGHLDTMNIFLRALRASGISLKTHGRYHPMPNIALSDALPVGVESFCEYIEIETNNEKIIDGKLIEGINRLLPRGIKIYEFFEDVLKNVQNGYTYILIAEKEASQDALDILLRTNEKIFYAAKTKNIKQLMQQGIFERIIKVEDKRIYGFRTHN